MGSTRPIRTIAAIRFSCLTKQQIFAIFAHTSVLCGENQKTILWWIDILGKYSTAMHRFSLSEIENDVLFDQVLRSANGRKRTMGAITLTCTWYKSKIRSTSGRLFGSDRSNALMLYSLSSCKQSRQIREKFASFKWTSFSSIIFEIIYYTLLRWTTSEEKKINWRCTDTDTIRRLHPNGFDSLSSTVLSCTIRSKVWRTFQFSLHSIHSKHIEWFVSCLLIP